MKLKYSYVKKYGNKKFPVYVDDNNQEFLLKKVSLDKYDLIKKIKKISINKNLSEIKYLFINNNEIFYFENHYDAITLTNFLRKNKFSIDNLIFIISEICNGLNELHKNGIIHRDIKPDNIIIENGNIRITDYNIARNYQENKKFDTQYLGTKDFAAPEQYGFEQTTIKSDIFGLGKTIEFLIKNEEFVEKVFFEKIVAKCIEIDPKNRFNSVDEIMKLIIKKMDDDIKKQLINAKELGFSKEEIDLIYKINLNAKQIGVLKHAINEKIDHKTINLMLSDNFDSKQMWQIKKGYLDGLSIEQINKYSKIYFSSIEMAIYRNGLIKNKKQSEIYEYIKHYNIVINIYEINNEILIDIKKLFYNYIELKEIYSKINEFNLNKK